MAKDIVNKLGVHSFGDFHGSFHILQYFLSRRRVTTGEGNIRKRQRSHKLTELYAAALGVAGVATVELDGERCFLAGVTRIAEMI